MGGVGSGRLKKRYNIPGLGYLKLKTIIRLIETKHIKLTVNIPEVEKYDSIIVDDGNNRIIIKAIKKLVELE